MSESTRHKKLKDLLERSYETEINPWISKLEAEKAVLSVAKDGHEVPGYFNRLLNSTNDYRANQLLNGPPSSPLDNLNSQRFLNRINATNGDPDAASSLNRRFIGNKGDAIDNIIQQTTDSYDTAVKIGETGIAINNFLLLLPAIGGSAATTTNRGFPLRFNVISPVTASSEFSPLPESYFNMSNAVDMNACPKYYTTNAQGYPRNGNWFFKRVFNSNPDQFSDDNVYNIFTLKKAPAVDDVWLQYNPMHRNFTGQRLIHHHIDQENIAVPLPDIIHQGWSRALHPYTGQ